MLTGRTPFTGHLDELIRQHEKRCRRPFGNSIGKCPGASLAPSTQLLPRGLRKTPDCRGLRIITESRLRRQRHAVESCVCSLQRQVSNIPQDIADSFHAAHGADPPVQSPRQAARSNSKRQRQRSRYHLWFRNHSDQSRSQHIRVRNRVRGNGADSRTIYDRSAREPRISAAVATLKRRWFVFSAATMISHRSHSRWRGSVSNTWIVGGGDLCALCTGCRHGGAGCQGDSQASPHADDKITYDRPHHNLVTVHATGSCLDLCWANVNVTVKLGDDWKPRQAGIDFNLSARSTLYQFLNILVTPLSSIIAGMLYLKTRQAGGETLADIFDQVYRDEMPRSRWQARMRSRFTR